MSDHEDGGLDDWEEGTLPGTPAIDTSYANSESLIKPSRHIPPPQRGPLPNRSNARLPTASRRDGVGRDDRYSRKPPTRGIPGRATGVESRQVRPSLPQANPATESHERHEPPTASWVLSQTWLTMLTNINPGDLPPARLARLRLDEIAESTETYIETPDNHSTEIWIWGAKDQVAMARDRLKLWEREVRETGHRPHRTNWVKQTALDGRFEQRQAREKSAKVTASQWKAFGESLDHSFELCLLWPQSIGVEDFREEYASTIADLEEAYSCRILCNRIHSMIQVFAHQEIKVIQVQERLINIGREIIAKRNEVIRANVLRYPMSTTYKSGVKLTKDEATGSFLPSLHGSPMPENEIEAYEMFSKGVNHKTRVKIRRLVDKGLTGFLQLSNKHVRMRVNFLELAFHQYKKPSDDKDHHYFSEYVDMVGDERIAIRPQGFRSNGKDLRQLDDKLTERLGHPSIAYTVHFDFAMDAARKDATMRLEWELEPSYMEGETQTTGKRWLEHRSEAEDDLLLINMLDFERPGYQVAIRAVPLRAVSDDMELFSRNIEFTPPREGIKAAPTRRAKFPPGRQMLNKISEITILRYIFKEKGVFELRRRDAYSPGVTGGSKEIRSDWSATYYYREWDNDMGQFADLKPGQDVDFRRSVTTFFPASTDEKQEAGLKRFTNEIEELQTLLGICIDALPQAGTNGEATKTEANGASANLETNGESKTEVNGTRQDIGSSQAKGASAGDSKGKGKAIAESTSPNTSKKRPKGPEHGRRSNKEVLH